MKTIETRLKMRDSKLGEKNPNWNGGITILKDYVYILKPDHHFANSHGRVAAHRLVWEEHNKASLLSWGDIHHKNGIKSDNRPENLIGLMNTKHAELHHPRKDMSKRQCIKCGSFSTHIRTRYGKKYTDWHREGNDFLCKNCYESKRRHKNQ
jgi:hypothetical protein